MEQKARQPSGSALARRERAWGGETSAQVVHRDGTEATVGAGCGPWQGLHLHVEGPRGRRVEYFARKEQADAALSNLRQSITKLAPLFKNNGFHDESEWRVVAENPTSTIHFRAGNSNLIPYITLPILQFSNSAIGEVIIGPNENLHNCVDSISMLLETNGIDGVNIIPSKLPLQHW